MKNKRCFGEGKPFYETYHDEEWGIPSHDDRHLFEMLCLEGAQAGLSWELILKRRDGYRKAFFNFDPVKLAAMTDRELQELRLNHEIIRNQKKIWAVRQNARIFLEIQEEFGSFDRYIWGFVDGKPIVNDWKRVEEVPCLSPLSETIGADLKKRGMTFVGPKIIYSFMQAIGMVDDHLADCLCRL